MNKSLRYLAVLAILPLFTVGLGTNYFADVEAVQGGGVGSSKYGSSTNVCGLQLCSDYPGGKAAWNAERSGSEPVAPAIEEEDESSQEISQEEMNDDASEDKMHDDDASEDKMHDDDASEDKMANVDSDSVLRLSRANVPATIPMHQGYYNGENVYFIITDSSDPTHADIITENQGWQVELAPLLKNAPVEALSKTYMFTNGIDGDGVHGFQGEVFTSTPAQEDVYSALTSHVHVTWNEGVLSRVLDSEEMIMAAAEDGQVTLTEVDVVLNMPQIVWPEGQMTVKEDKTLTDETPYGGGQVLDIDTEEMNVTFIAHRGWGPDGRTIYYIVTDATPSGPAEMMGVVSTPTSANLIANSAAVDLFQFRNGMTGSGPLGFQPGIAAGAPGDENYSPMWRISMIGWNTPENAQLLETIDDMNAYKEAGLIDIGLARPMDSDHIVNCPFIDPFQ